mgnify:CR=1 FL=1
MQTQMAEAMNKALVAQGMKPKTQMELIWRYIKDHPETRLKTLEAIFKRSTAQTLHSLWIRKMVTRTLETVRGRQGNIRQVYCYKVAMLDYELLPLPVKTKTKTGKKPGSPVTMPLPYPPLAEPQPSLTAAQPDDLDERINKMPVGEARVMYVKLKAIFG